MDPLTIRPVPADAPELAPLFARHLTLMRASSPACSVHAMEAGDLAGAEARMFAVEDGAGIVAMGALKRIAADHLELKSMHVLDHARGRGIARRLLRHLLAEGRGMGATRISLETGVQDAFAPARALYLSEGFEPCAPFAGYGPDPNSAFLTRAL